MSQKRGLAKITYSLVWWDNNNPNIKVKLSIHHNRIDRIPTDVVFIDGGIRQIFGAYTHKCSMEQQNFKIIITTSIKNLAVQHN